MRDVGCGVAEVWDGHVDEMVERGFGVEVGCWW